MSIQAISAALRRSSLMRTAKIGPFYSLGFSLICPVFSLFVPIYGDFSEKPYLTEIETFSTQKEEKHSRTKCFCNWWEVVDSNHRSHRRQIYSLFPLATRETSHMNFFTCLEKRWSWWTDLNPRPADYKSAALPTELHQHFFRFCLSVSATCL